LHTQEFINKNIIPLSETMENNLPQQQQQQQQQQPQTKDIKVIDLLAIIIQSYITYYIVYLLQTFLHYFIKDFLLFPLL